MSKTSIPVTKNQHYPVDIVDLGIKGEGIGKRGQFTLYIPNALPGDTVEARVLKLKQRYGYAKCIRVITPSPHRITPPCPVANVCGGCQIQQYDYEAQLAYKQKKVADDLARIGQFTDITLRPIIGMDTPFWYRNKAQFAIGEGKDGPEIGLYKINTHDIVDIERCYIQHDAGNQILLLVRQAIQESGVSIYDEVTHQGLLRHVMMRYSFSQDKVMVTLVINAEHCEPKQFEIFSRLLSSHPSVVSLYVNHNTIKGDTVLGPSVTHIWGDLTIEEMIGEIKYHISPLSFFQVNPVQTKVLYDVIKDAILESKPTVLWDLYCGAGTIGLYLSPYCDTVIGIESHPAAVRDAKANAALNATNNIEFYEGFAEELLKKPSHPIFSNIPEVVVLDPPRKGCEPEVLTTVLETKASCIVYVSCNPSTLARDLRILCDGGYYVEYIQPVDMFPHTVHIESVAVLRKVHV